MKIYHNKLSNLIKIKCLIEKKPLGTYGALSQLRNKVKNDFILMNGDSFVNVDLSFLFKHNLPNKYVALIFLIKKVKHRSIP